MPTVTPHSSSDLAGQERTALRTRARTVVAAHPVASAIGIMMAIGWSLMIPAALAGLPLEPFVLVTALVGQLGGAVLVTAAADGRAGVKDLFARTFRWRVRPALWVVALFGIAVPSLALVSAVFGWGALKALVTDPSVVTGWLLGLTILPIINLWEEMSWTGVIQSRLMARHGLVAGSLITAPFFVLVHLPLQIGRPLSEAAIGLLVLALVAGPFRIIIGWLYEKSGSSVLLVALFHTAFNATNNGSLLLAASPANEVAVRAAPWIVTALWGTGVVVSRWRRVRATV